MVLTVVIRTSHLGNVFEGVPLWLNPEMPAIDLHDPKTNYNCESDFDRGYSSTDTLRSLYHQMQALMLYKSAH